MFKAIDTTSLSCEFCVALFFHNGTDGRWRNMVEGQNSSILTCHSSLWYYRSSLSFTNCLWQLAKEFHTAAMVALTALLSYVYDYEFKCYYHFFLSLCNVHIYEYEFSEACRILCCVTIAWYAILFPLSECIKSWLTTLIWTMQSIIEWLKIFCSRLKCFVITLLFMSLVEVEPVNRLLSIVFVIALD